MKMEKWPGTRAFSVKFKIERARVAAAKHNKRRTYVGVAYIYNLSIEDFVPENWPQIL